MTLTTTRPTRRRGRLAKAAATGGLALVGAAGLAAPAGAAPSTTFSAEYANARWASDSYEVEIAPGEHNDRGKKTEYLHTRIRASYCKGGYRYEVALEKREEAKDLRGVEVDTADIEEAEAKVGRKTSMPGTLTKTPVAADCVTATGAPVKTAINPTVEIKAEWEATGESIAYSGEDCGGDGACNYVGAEAEGEIKFSGREFDLGETTTDAWLWNGTWTIGD